MDFILGTPVQHLFFAFFYGIIS